VTDRTPRRRSPVERNGPCPTYDELLRLIGGPRGSGTYLELERLQGRPDATGYRAEPSDHAWHPELRFDAQRGPGGPHQQSALGVRGSQRSDVPTSSAMVAGDPGALQTNKECHT
jgi:hypothetical protein